MSEPPAKSLPSHVFNLPNQLTTLRLVLAVVMFALISWDCFLLAFLFFVLAASTDWLDGYYARKYNLVTTLGRILDPFADKVIVCGAFIYLLAEPVLVRMPWGLRAWMVVVVVGRELLVTALRSFLEQRGADFSAKMSGKLKMVFQCVAAGSGLFYLWRHSVHPEVPAWMGWFVAAATWVAVLSTIYSGLIYLRAAIRLLRKK